jgi:DNA-binding response OmpR family regulator
LDYLHQHRGKVCTRDELSNYLYKEKKRGDKSKDEKAVEPSWDGYDTSNEVIDGVIKRLRERVESDPSHRRYILTERGVGFKLVDSDDML